MVSLGNKPVAKQVRFDDDHLWVDLSDGRIIGVPLAFFPRLLRATKEQQARWEMSGGGTGLHWDEIDEDISVEGLLYGIADRTKQSRTGQIVEEVLSDKPRGRVIGVYGSKKPTSRKNTKSRSQGSKGRR